MGKGNLGFLFDNNWHRFRMKFPITRHISSQYQNKQGKEGEAHWSPPNPQIIPLVSEIAKDGIDEVWTLPLMQITFVCFIYPVLLLTYAGQAAFVSKYLGVADAFHLSESIPNSKICFFFKFSFYDSWLARSTVLTTETINFQRIFSMYLLCYRCLLQQ